MRVLLTQSSPGLLASNGGSKSNFHIMKSLAGAGHSVRILYAPKEEEFEREVTVPEVSLVKYNGCPSMKVYKFKRCDIEFVSCPVLNYERLMKQEGFNELLLLWLKDEAVVHELDYIDYFIRMQIKEFQPTHILFNESVTMKIVSNLRYVVRVFICHALEHLPFGPYAEVPGFLGGKTEVEHQRLKTVDGIIAVSKAVQRYIKERGDLESVHIPLPVGVYGEGPFNHYKNFHDGYVVAINPGVVKGFDIFKEVAKDLPHVKFAAVKSWSTCEHIQQQLSTLPNVTVFPPFNNMDELMKLTKVLLVPSLWNEAFGIVVIEAMLRGIPVIASNTGGLPEASLGVGENVPVNVINGDRCNDKTKQSCCNFYKVPKQDASPWIERLRTLLENEQYYNDISNRSRESALQFLNELNPKCYEQYLENLSEKKRPSQSDTMILRKDHRQETSVLG